MVNIDSVKLNVLYTSLIMIREWEYRSGFMEIKISVAHCWPLSVGGQPGGQMNGDIKRLLAQLLLQGLKFHRGCLKTTDIKSNIPCKVWFNWCTSLNFSCKSEVEKAQVKEDGGHFVWKCEVVSDKNNPCLWNRLTSPNGGCSSIITFGKMFQKTMNNV